MSDVLVHVAFAGGIFFKAIDLDWCVLFSCFQDIAVSIGGHSERVCYILAKATLAFFLLGSHHLPWLVTCQTRGVRGTHRGHFGRIGLVFAVS